MTSFVLIMVGFPTGDVNPIYIAPMLGAHQPVQTTGFCRYSLIRCLETWTRHWRASARLTSQCL